MRYRLILNKATLILFYLTRFLPVDIIIKRRFGMFYDINAFLFYKEIA